MELNDGVPHLGAVVTNELDWSLAPVPDWMDSTVTVRASHAKGAVILRASANGGAWRMLRVAPSPTPPADTLVQAVCAPQRAGLNVTFTRWSCTAPDADLHVDLPLLELGPSSDREPRDGGGGHGSPGLRIDVGEPHAARTELEGAVENGQIELTRTDRARVEHGEAALLGDERHMRVSAHDQRRALRARSPGHVGSQTRSGRPRCG